MKTWTTADGTVLKIKNMETSHIINCIRMLERKLKEGNGRVVEIIGDVGWHSDEALADEIDITDSVKEKIKYLNKELSNRV